MDDRLMRVESTLRDLERSMTALERRMSTIERQIAAVAQPAGSPPSGENAVDASLPVLAASEPSLAGAPGIVPVLSLLGRTFVVLGGAFLLRALTDSAILPVTAGIALGLAYAIASLLMADRAAASRRPLSASFHGAAASLVAFPLIWEAATKFAVLGPNGAAAALTGVTGLGLAVAVRQRLQPLAWIVTTAALPTAIALVAGTGALVPFAIAAILLGVATLWISYTLDWTLLRWPVAFVADLLVVGLPMRVSAGTGGETAAAVVATELLLLTGYLASIAARTLIRQRDVNAFEVLQASAALAIGFGGALYTARATGSGTTLLAATNLLIGGGCYGVAFAFVARHQGVRRNFYFYTSLAIVLVLVSAALLLDGSSFALVSVALAGAASWLGRRTDRRLLAIHSAVYAIAAAGASGLLKSATAAMLLPVAQWPPFSATAILVLAALGGIWTIPPSQKVAATDLSVRLPRMLIAATLFWSLCGWMVAVSTPFVAALLGGVDDGIVATVRTAVLGAGSVLVAWIGRHARFHETGWLLYPVLAAGGIKLLTEDVPRSRPSALFIALAVYGIVLIAAPRLRQLHPAR